MTTDNIWNDFRVRVSARSGERLQMVNAHNEGIKLNAVELTAIDLDLCVVDLSEYSDRISASLPLFLPAKPHRSGFHDNDNTPFNC